MMIYKGKYPGLRQAASLGIPPEPVADHTITIDSKCRLFMRGYFTLWWHLAGQRRMVQERLIGSIPGLNVTGASSSALVSRTTQNNNMKTLTGHRRGGFIPGGIRTGNSEKYLNRDNLRVLPEPSDLKKRTKRRQT